MKLELNLNTKEERKLIELCKVGNKRAQRHIYEKYVKSMFNICLHLMKTKEEAEDVLQEVFADAFKNLDEFRFESTFGYWLKKITINKCINALRKKNINFVNTDFNNNEEENLIENESFEIDEYDEDLNKKIIEEIKRIINELPEGYRVIFSLYLFEGYSHSEIAQILNISESTSKSQYLRAKRKIKEILKNKGYGKI